MTSFLISILILLIIAYVVYVVIQWLPLPDPIKTIVNVIFGLIVLVKLFAIFGFNTFLK